MTHKTKTISWDARVRTFWTLVSICVLCLILYIYAVNVTIRNTVARQDLEGEVAQLAVEQSSLEFAYIERKHNINIEVAHAYGFRDTAPLYVSRTSATALVLNTD